jgi:hypothetical protein
LARSIADVVVGPPASRETKRLNQLTELRDAAAVEPGGIIAGLLGS